MRIYFSAAGQSFGHAATNWHSKSYYRHVQVTICFLCLYSFEFQFLWYFIVNDDVYELLTTKPCIKIEEKAPHPRHSERLLHKSKVTWAKPKPTNSVRRQEQDVNLFQFRKTILGKRKSTPSARAVPQIGSPFLLPF